MNDIQRNAAALMGAQTVGLVPPAPTTAGIVPLTLSAEQAAQFTFKAPPMQPVLRMYNQGGECGTLRFDENGMFQFEGDASASAQVLFAEMKRLSGK